MIALPLADSRHAPRARTRMGVRKAGLAAVRTVASRFALDRQIGFWMRELDPTWSLTGLRARVVDVIDETHDVKTFVLAPNRRWSGHRAGQFVTLEVEIDGVRTVRCYSLSSAPRQPHPAITVKRVVGGRVSSWLHEHLRPGDVVRLGSPAGDFVLPAPAPSKLLLLSGGSGATPVMSILRDLADQDAVRDVVFLHAARSAKDVIFHAELEALARRHWGLRVAILLEDAGALGGRLDAEKLQELVPDFAVRNTFLCGPPGMMDALAPVWSANRVPHRLKMERFVPPSSGAVTRDAAPANVKLKLARSGRTITATGSQSLLEQLERAGERPVYGCRMGICHTCRCRKRAGIVENIVTGAVSAEPDVDIRLCISRARTDLELAL